MKTSLSLRFEKREKLSIGAEIIIQLASILVALLLCAIIIRTLGHSPVRVYLRILRGAFGSFNNFTQTILQATPLMLCSLGVTVALKMSLTNLGAEGQYVMGAYAAAWFALFFPVEIPDSLMMVCILIAGFLFGALWGVVAILPKVIWGVNETIVSLMFNYVALLWVDYWVYGAWRDTSNANLPYSPMFPESAMLTRLGNTHVTTAFIIAIFAGVIIHLFYKYTSKGYQMQVIGANQNAARYAGMNIKSSIVLAMVFSGGLAGLAGVAQTSGAVGRLQPMMANGAGYTAIAIAWLARLNPLVVLIVALLFGALTQGGYCLQIMGINSNVITMLQGAILFFVLAGEVFTRNRVVILRTPKTTIDRKEDATA